MPKEIVYLSLGSNEGESRALLKAATELVAGLAGVRLLAESNVYYTAPRDDEAQPWFYNQVLSLECDLEPLDLLARLQEIEARLGRRRGRRRYGPRSMDIDVLIHGTRVLKMEKLVLPHPRLLERAFALVPLSELAPDLPVPGTNLSVCRALDKISHSSLDKRIIQYDTNP